MLFPSLLPRPKKRSFYDFTVVRAINIGDKCDIHFLFFFLSDALIKMCFRAVVIDYFFLYV